MKCPTCNIGDMQEAGSLPNWWCPQCGTRINPSGERFVPTIIPTAVAIGESLLKVIDKFGESRPDSGDV